MARRRISRRPQPTFRIGNRVTVDGDYNGDYTGTVIEIGRYTKAASLHEPNPQTKPGAVVLVDTWEGRYYVGDERFEVVAWDCEAHRAS